MTSFFILLCWRALEAQLFYKQFILLKKELTTARMDLEGVGVRGGGVGVRTCLRVYTKFDIKFKQAALKEHT